MTKKNYFDQVPNRNQQQQYKLPIHFRSSKIQHFEPIPSDLMFQNQKKKKKNDCFYGT
jgi:hypothetical protein